MQNPPFSQYFNFDLERLLENAVLVKEHIKEGEIQSIEYQTELEDPVLGIFDVIRIRIGSSKKELSKATPIILTFLLHNTELTGEKAKYVVNAISDCCGEQDYWAEIDGENLASGIWRGRSFFIGTKMVSIEWDDEDGFSLCITGYQEYI